MNAGIDYAALDDLLARGLREDVGSGDVTTLATVPADRSAHGYFVAREAGSAAGLEAAARVFALLDEQIDIKWEVDDGDIISAQSRFGRVTGPARAILTGERLALNILQRMSGIATASRALAEAARPARLLDTRKTAPGLRMLDKWAVRLGGAENHRAGLYDRFLIKDNHITAAGGITAAIDAARRYRSQHAPELLIEVEARTLEEVGQVVEHGGIDWILLDNMVRLHDDGLIDVTLLRHAVSRVAGRFTTEASGNVTLATIAAIAATGVDFISSGALTHSVRALDVALELQLAETTSRGDGRTAAPA